MKNLFIAILVCLLVVGCGRKEQSTKVKAVVDSTPVQTKVDPVEDVNKHLEAVLQYYHSLEKPQNTPVKACYDATSKIYFLKFPITVSYTYKDDEGTSQETINHYAGWNSIYEQELTFVTIGNGSLTVTSGPDTSKNISANLDGLPCLNFSQLSKVWDNQ